jgi:hypothetical protein
MTAQPVDIEHRVEQYVALRDEIKRRDDQHKEEMKPFRELLDKFNGELLNALEAVNGKSVSTSAGTVYRTEKKSAALADPGVFMQFVIDNELFDLLDRKANVTAVADYLKDKGELPPGVNFSTTFVAGVRRK